MAAALPSLRSHEQPLFITRRGFPPTASRQADPTKAAVGGNGPFAPSGPRIRCWPDDPNAPIGPTITHAKYRAAHARFVGGEQRMREEFIAVRNTDATTLLRTIRPRSARGVSRTTSTTPRRESQDAASGTVEAASTPRRPSTPLVTHLATTKLSKIAQMTASTIAMLERDIVPTGSPPSPPPSPPPIATSAAAAPAPPVDLGPTEAALARCEAAVAAARDEARGPAAKPSPQRVELARSQLRETKAALAALRGEVAASLGTLKAQMEADVQAAFAAQGWTPPAL